MNVMKFGGTSVATPEAMTRCAELVEREIKVSGEKPIVVVSAYGRMDKQNDKITDLLLNAARGAVKGEYGKMYEQVVRRHRTMVESMNLPDDLGMDNLGELRDLLAGIHLVKEITPRLYDYVASFGERLSAKCFAAVMRKRGHDNALAVNAYDFGMITDSKFMSARPLPDVNERIAGKYRELKDKLLIVTGFVGKDANGDITTLGRGGSDFTASIYGAALGSKEVQIWTDVPGVMTCDPSLIKNARPLPRISFEEASELAYYGAEVIHPATMLPAMEKDVPIRVLHTFDPDAPGTLITATGGVSAGCPVKAIVYKEDQTLINVRSERMLGMEGFMARMYGVFERIGIVVDMISTSEVSVSMTTRCTDAGKLEMLRSEMAKLARVDIQRDKCILAVVGEGMKNTIGLAARACKAIAAAGVSLQMISQGASEINIMFLVGNDDLDKAVPALHDEFFPR